MTDEELEAVIDAVEADLAEAVGEALALTAEDFMSALDDATELVAARFRVSDIGAMWRRRVGPLVSRLRGVARQSAETSAEDLGESLPDGWESRLDDYEASTRALLDAVGDRLTQSATQALVDGLNAGEDVDALRDRLTAVFAADGSELGAVRANRIAVTEATRAWNSGTLAAAQALTGPERPLVKQWITRNDANVRPSHRAANGQLRLLDDPFDVGGVPMQYPGDPSAPAAETVLCRCVLKTAVDERQNVTGTGSELSAAAAEHTGAMIALVPSDDDAARLALEGGESADQLHTTLFFLGEAVDWTADQRGDLIGRVSDAARALTPIGARVFGAAQWNPASDDPAWVWSVGNDNGVPGSTLEDAHRETVYVLEGGHDVPELPVQHTPWVAHITAAYSVGDWRELMQARVGPVTFDRIRVAFGGQLTDIPLTGSYIEEPMPEITDDEAAQVLGWHTPGSAALAFENQQTGDGRVFAPGALYWEGGPWPLQYADEMRGGHDGARLAGAIHSMANEDGRILGDGVLYLTQPAGVEAALLLSQGAPLGVSVDLDDVDVALVEADGATVYTARLATASVLPLERGGWHLTGETVSGWTASGAATFGESVRVDLVTGPDGAVNDVGRRLFAAAGDRGDGGTVLDIQRSGDMLMRITRARVRGATLVSIPAFANARIALDTPYALAASHTSEEVTAAIKSTTDYDRVLRHVRSSKVPVGAARVAQMLRMPVVAAQRILATAASRGEVVRLTRGLYTDKTTSARADHVMDDDRLSASDLVASLEEVAAMGDPLFDGVTDDESVELEAAIDGMASSAWTAMRDMPPMPASWFAEPTVEELPPGGAGVNYSNGRIFGWVAQAGEPHAGFAKKITIDTLGRIDTTHFLRQRFTLDNGSTVKAGAFTMGVGHHRDGAECETAACQFDDSRSVAGIVTVGMNARGMWFSGAASPWLSEWDRNVFMALQPSYHLRKGGNGNWQLRAVLSVPVPGHSSPLLASAVVERAQLALTAAATMYEVEEAVAAATATAVAPVADTVAVDIDYDLLADSMVAAMARAEDRKAADTARLAALRAEAAKLFDDTTETVEGI